MRFSRKGGIYRSDVVPNQNQSQSQNQIPGREPTASRWSAPSPGKRTRREDHALLIVRDEFRTGYSSIGLLASRARLRFTGIAIIKRWTAGRKRIIIERYCVFSLVSHARGSPHYRRSSAFIGRPMPFGFCASPHDARTSH